MKLHEWNEQRLRTDPDYAVAYAEVLRYEVEKEQRRADRAEEVAARVTASAVLRWLGRVPDPPHPDSVYRPAYDALMALRARVDALTEDLRLEREAHTLNAREAGEQGDAVRRLQREVKRYKGALEEIMEREAVESDLSIFRIARAALHDGGR